MRLEEMIEFAGPVWDRFQGAIQCGSFRELRRSAVAVLVYTA